MQAKWKHFNNKNKTLTIPAKNQKGDRKHKLTAPDFIIPLDDFAIGLLKEVEADSEYIFYGKTGDKPLSDKVLGRSVRRLLPKLDLEEGFTPHDLRRTLRTRLSKLGVMPHIAEKCLNHSLGKINRTYDQGDYLVERRGALAKWSRYVQRVVGTAESNVVPLRKVS